MTALFRQLPSLAAVTAFVAVVSTAVHMFGA
jgi:hypothetical protein